MKLMCLSIYIAMYVIITRVVLDLCVGTMKKNWAQRLHSNNKLKHKVQCNNWQVFSADITQRTGPLQTVFTLLTYLDERLKTCLATRNGRNICTNKSYTFSLSPRRIPIEFINCLRLRFEIAIYCNIFQNIK